MGFKSEGITTLFFISFLYLCVHNNKKRKMAEKPTGVLICAILFAIGGIIGVLGGLGMMLMGGAMFGVGAEEAGFLAGLFGVIGIVVLLVGLAELAVAWGMWTMQSWARIVGIILAVISLINIPIGTIIGLIILYFLLIDEKTKAAFK